MSVQIQLRRDAGKIGANPWIRRKQVARVLGPPDPGEIATLVDHRKRVLGHGLYSPDSGIVLRLLSFGERPPAPHWLEGRLAAAVAGRARLGLGTESAEPTHTGYREVNSEGDGLPGLVIDRYGDWRVVQLTTAPMVARRESIARWLEGGAPSLAGGVIWLGPDSAASKEGFEPFVEVRAADGSSEGPERLRWLEDGRTLEAPAPPSQKTGAYHDQRDNRARFAALCAAHLDGAEGSEPRTLDLGAHIGGFALALAARGCRVVAVDSSELALDFVARNAEGAGLSDRIERVNADMFGELDSPALAGPFLGIVFDPPKIASSRRDLGRALGAMSRTLARLLPRLVEGGSIAVCSCSQHIDDAALDHALLDAARRSERPCTRIATWGPGPDHPVWPGHEAGSYLRVHVFQRR